jgi:hypothetical protein
MGGLNTAGKSAQFVFSAVTGDFFTGLGLKPAAGRLFVPGEGERPGSELLCVVSHTYWQKRFGGDPAIVGRQVRIDGKPARVVGVAPKGFHGPYAGVDMDGYLSFSILDSPEFPQQVFTNRSWRPHGPGAPLPGSRRRSAKLTDAVCAWRNSTPSRRHHGAPMRRPWHARSRSVFWPMPLGDPDL